jgi:hypothetical protein
MPSPIARRILAEMELTPSDVEQSISYFMGNGECCDCDILLNVDQLPARRCDATD